MNQFVTVNYALLRQHLRCRQVLTAFADERLEQGHNILLLLLRQLQRDDRGVQVRILDAALIVKSHHFLQRLKPPVVYLLCCRRTAY